MSVRVQSEPFDMGEELQAFTAAHSHSGAVVTFSGLVRDEGGTLSRMEIEHYPGMTEKALTSIRNEALTRFALDGAGIIHRFGTLVPGDQIMMVVTAARHRADAFAAAEFLMDYLKSRAPFWKKEFGSDGEGWVEARTEDDVALNRW